MSVFRRKGFHALEETALLKRASKYASKAADLGVFVVGGVGMAWLFLFECWCVKPLHPRKRFFRDLELLLMHFSLLVEVRMIVTNDEFQHRIVKTMTILLDYVPVGIG